MKKKGLAAEGCLPYRGARALFPSEVAVLWPQIPGWAVASRAGVRRLEKAFLFPDYSKALSFAIKIGRLADVEDHHPQLLIEWGRVTVSWWTHTVKGLHRNDFVMAAKTDRLAGKRWRG